MSMPGTFCYSHLQDEDKFVTYRYLKKITTNKKSNNMTTPKGVNINVTKNGGNVYVDGYHDAGVEISFENLTSNDLDYTSGPKSPISFKAELQTLKATNGG